MTAAAIAAPALDGPARGRLPALHVPRAQFDATGKCVQIPAGQHPPKLGVRVIRWWSAII